MSKDNATTTTVDNNRSTSSTSLETTTTKEDNPTTTTTYSEPTTTKKDVVTTTIQKNTTTTQEITTEHVHEYGEWYTTKNPTCIEGGAFLSCLNLTVYCGTESKPDGWDSSWNPDNRPVT